jgi:hypothetical protein
MADRQEKEVYREEMVHWVRVTMGLLVVGVCLRSEYRRASRSIRRR